MGVTALNGQTRRFSGPGQYDKLVGDKGLVDEMVNVAMNNHGQVRREA
jgi:hypothetical protein